MKYILVRHVETFGNAEHRLNGHTESDYTDFGVKMLSLIHILEERVGVIVYYNFLVTPLLTLLMAAGACFVAWFRMPRPAFDVRHLLFALVCLVLYGGIVYMILDGQFF